MVKYASASANGTTTWSGDHVLLPYMNDNQWYHFAAVRNGTSFKMYVDGIETLSTSGFNIHAGTAALTHWRLWWCRWSRFTNSNKQL